MIEIRTFRAPAVLHDGQLLEGLAAQRQKLALLVYLALEGPVSRDRIVAVFWPERPEDRARHSLNQALYALRRELGEEHFGGNGDSVSLEGDVRVDARELEAAARDERWSTVVELYEGSFLERFAFPDSTPFDQWQTATRARLARHARRGFAQVVAGYVGEGRLQDALATAARWASLEPLEDEAQHAFIGLLALTGDRTGALREFEAYRERLDRELEVEPLEQTLTLIERLRAGDLSEFELLGTRVSPPASSRPTTSRPRASRREAEPPATPGRTAETPRVRESAAMYAVTPRVGSPEGAPRAATGGDENPSGRSAQPLLLQRIGSELRARPIFQITALYLAVAWVAIQVADLLIDRGLLPGWLFGGLLFALALGLPAAMLVGWAQEQANRDSLRGGERGLPRIGPRRATVGLIVMVLAVLGAQTLADSQRMAAANAAARESGLDPARIAVLYFDDYSPDQSLEHIVGGFAEGLIHELSQVDALDVVARNAVKHYQESDISLDSIVQELGVGTVVEGSLTRSGDMLRVTVQLIDGATLSHMLSVTLDRPMSELLELEGELTREVSRMLRKRLGQEIRLREQRAGASDLKAWELVRRAEAMREDYRALRLPDKAAGTDALLTADSLLATAEELDSKWVEPPLARARIAIHLARLAAEVPGGHEEGWTRAGIAHTERALQLEPGNARALELRGLLTFELAEIRSGREASELYAQAEEHLRASLQADPGRARAWGTLAEVLRVQRRFAPAKRAAQRALEADAFLEEASTVVHVLYHTSLELRQFGESERWCREGREAYPDDARFMMCGLFILVSSPMVRPDVDSAWALADAYLRLTNEASHQIFRPYVHTQVAKVIVLEGMPDSAEAVLRRARGPSTPSWLGYDEAHYRLLRGEREEALRLLEQYLRFRPNRRAYLPGDWWFRALWDDPAFLALTADPG